MPQRRTLVPPYKARRRQRERAAFVNLIRLHGDSPAVSAHDAAQCQRRDGVSPSRSVGGVPGTPLETAGEEVHLCQDLDRGLSQWHKSKPGAMRHAREAVAGIAQRGREGVR